MKIIITFASAGTGHNRAAGAIYNYLKEHDKEIEIKLIDALNGTNIIFKIGYSYGYFFIVKYAPLLWRWGFCLSSNRLLRSLFRRIVFILGQLNLKKFAKILIQEDPDFIISTHFLPSEIAAYLKKTKKINSKIITVITDFGVHPFWISDGTDLYVVASGITKEHLIFEGIREDKIKEFGIPIESKFLQKYDIETLCKKLDIEKNKFTVLIVTGSFGIGPIEETVDLLYQDVQILAVCANNRRLFIRLKNKNYQNVKVYGFVDNIEELMLVSDIIITKPGGLSIAEILAMELVPIFIAPIPGQETENAKILKRYKVGISPKKVKDIKDIILDYKEHPEKQDSVRENIKVIKKPFAVQDLCHAIRQGSIWPAH